MTTLVLVHGAYHGAWCWSRLVPELESRGLNAVTPELPCDDPAAGLADSARHRLGGRDPVLVPGSHSPFLSRPAVLADVLAAESGG
jgi:hypothetical protein